MTATFRLTLKVVMSVEFMMALMTAMTVESVMALMTAMTVESVMALMTVMSVVSMIALKTLDCDVHDVSYASDPLLAPMKVPTLTVYCIFLVSTILPWKERYKLNHLFVDIL
jgi:hypothetical protein